MDKELKKLLLTELNMISYKVGNEEKLNDRNLIKAMTANENITTIGYTLRPGDIVLLAASESCDGIYDEITDILSEVKAKPMYPDFPNQVMKMDIAQFRLHQFVHYFSTYGIECLCTKKVSKGWLPSVEDTEKTQNDIRLLELKVLELIPENCICENALERILAKRERMTIPEADIVSKAVAFCSDEFLATLKILFKENAGIVFDKAMEMKREDGLRLLTLVCQHSTDALKNIYRILKGNNYHFKTSQKKLFVRLLESFSAKDFTSNLMKSAKDRERTLLILQKLDFNTYAKSEEHIKAVFMLRNNELKSWDSVANRMIENHEEGALDFLAMRPGSMLRMVNRLLSLGYSEEDIAGRLCLKASALNTQTLVTLLNKFSELSKEEILASAKERRDSIVNMYQRYYAECEESAVERYRARAIQRAKDSFACELESLKRKLLFEKDQELREWSLGRLELQEKREIAALEKDYRDEISKISWEYKEEMAGIDASLKECITQGKTATHILKERRAICDSLAAYYMSKGEADIAENLEENFLKNNISYEQYCLKMTKIKAEKHKLQEELDGKINIILERMQEETAERRREIEAFYVQKRSERKSRIEEIEKRHEILWKQAIDEDDNHKKLLERIKEINAICDKDKEELPKLRSEMEQKEAEEIANLEADVWRECKQLDSLPAKKRILSKVLRAHFENLDTCLRNKKVYIDMDEFDIGNSQLLCNNKSSEGGYIRSGIAYKIPKDASKVRFFVYWNDEERVDIDLHANGFARNGENIHVGWNADFNTYGVVHSGDITHSDAAEYIDIDLSRPVKRIYTNVALFSGKASFDQISDCYVGMMAVKSTKENVKLYNRANCFFAHDLKSKGRKLFYGYIDVEKRIVKFIGKDDIIGTRKWSEDMGADIFTLEKYLNIVFDTQNVQLVFNKNEADVVLSMGKSVYEKGISLVDENFFMDVA